MVGDDAIYMRFAVQQAQHFFGRSRLDHFITELAQHAGCACPHEVFIVDQQDAADRLRRRRGCILGDPAALPN